MGMMPGSRISAALEDRESVFLAIEHLQARFRDGIQNGFSVSSRCGVIGFQSGLGDLRIGRVDGKGQGDALLDFFHRLGHEARRARTDVDIDVGSAFFRLQPSQFDDAVDVVGFEQLVCGGNGIVDRLRDQR